MSITQKRIKKTGSWDLSDLVKDPNSSEFQGSIKSIEEKVKLIENKRQYLSNDISTTEFQDILYLIEDISERISIAAGYAQLKYSEDTSSNAPASLLTRMDQLSSDIANRLLFFDLWFRKELDEKNARRLIEAMPSVYREIFETQEIAC